MRRSSRQAIATHSPKAATRPDGTTSTGRSVSNSAACSFSRSGAPLPWIARSSTSEIRAPAPLADQRVGQSLHVRPDRHLGPLQGCRPAIEHVAQRRHAEVLARADRLRLVLGEDLLGQHDRCFRRHPDGEHVDPGVAHQGRQPPGSGQGIRSGGGLLEDGENDAGHALLPPLPGATDGGAPEPAKATPATDRRQRERVGFSPRLRMVAGCRA